MKRFSLRLVVVLVATFSCGNLFAAEPNKDSLNLVMQSRKLAKAVGRPATSRLVKKKVVWPPKQTALIICDMWDGHWCKGAARRVGEMAVPMNQMVKTARDRGIFIIHAPSSVVDYYDGTSARKLAKSSPLAKTPVPISTAKRWGTGWCWPDKQREPDMPIDDLNMGCDCKVKCKLPEGDKAPWTRQIKTIDIKDGDAISHDAQEVYNLLSQRKIDNVLIMGVHLNMCVLGRPLGIRQMVKLGKNVVLVRDMTDTMYDHRSKPYVNHFTGTDLVVQHIEKYWCPTITSDQVTGKKPFRFQEDQRRK